MRRLLIVFIGLFFIKGLAYALTVDHLRVESQLNPAIDSMPHFSWWLHSDKRGCVQVSYQIQIYDDKEMTSMVFDSGVKESDESQRVAADGFIMSPSTRYYWKVLVRDNHGEQATSFESAYFDSGLMDTGWSGAQWIMYPEEGNKSTGMPRFRKSFSIDKPVKSAFAYSSALGIYDLTLNGNRVGHLQSDGTTEYDELKPGWTDFRKTIYYNVHEISHYLNRGINVIGSDVTNGWWNGRISWGLYGDYPLGFIAKVVVFYEDGTSDVLVTDSGWKVTLNGPYKLGDIYNGEIYNAQLEEDWQNANFNDNSWSNAIVNNYFSGSIVIQTAGQVRMRNDMARRAEKVVIYEGTIEGGSDYGKINTVNTYSSFHSFKLNNGQSAIFDFGQNIVGYVKLSFKSNEGTEVRLRYAEMLNDTGAKDRGNDGPGGSLYLENLRNAKASSFYYCKGSVSETYCPVMTYFGFRYCEITADNDIVIEAITAIPISSVREEMSHITTNNVLVNRLFDNIQWGQLGNFVSVPTDCPQRDERWGWTGDTQVFSRTGMYNANSESLYRKFLADLRDSQREDGAYPDVAPYTKERPYGNAGWGDAGIIIPWNLYLMCGNKDILYEHFASMEKYMSFLSKQHKDGLTYSGAGTEYGDWLAFDKCNNRYLSMAYYAYDAILISKMAKVLCTSQDDDYSRKSQAYERLYDAIKLEFIEHYWNPLPEESTQATYILPLAFDLLDSEKKYLAIDKLKSKIAENNGLLSTGFLGTSLLLPTLSKIGMDSEAYSLLLQRENPSWLYSVDQGATTIWERWDSYTLEKGFGPASMNSFNHYAYGAVAEWMYRYMAGIDCEATNAGFKHFILRPTPDYRDDLPEGQERVKEVDATYNSIHGKIRSSWIALEDGSFEYSCIVPANTIATLYLPVTIPHTEIFENGIVASDSEGISFVGFQDNHHIYNLLPGEYHFHTRTSTVGIKGADEEKEELNCAELFIGKNREIIVKGNILELSLYNLSGQFIGKTINQNFINTAGIAAGVYLLNMKSDVSTKTYKIVIP